MEMQIYLVIPNVNSLTAFEKIETYACTRFVKGENSSHAQNLLRARTTAIPQKLLQFLSELLDNTRAT